MIFCSSTYHISYPSLGSIQSWWHWWRSFPCLWSFCSLFMWDIKGAACVSSNFHKISKIGRRRRGNQSCFVFTWNHIAMVCWRREGFFFLPPAKLWDRIQYLGPTVSSNKTEESNILDLQWKRDISQFCFLHLKCEFWRSYDEWLSLSSHSSLSSPPSFQGTIIM